MNSPRSLLLASASLLITATAPAVTIIDDFNDGNDTGWTRSSPLAGFGAGGVFTFPGGNSYQIHAPVSPNFGALGPARAGSFRSDGVYTSFSVQVDILDWDETKPSMAMGLLARVTNIGLGTTNGYSFTLDADADIGIARIAAEAPATIAAFDLGSIAPTDGFRLIFSGDGPNLTAQIFNLTNLVTPLATLNATDATYSSGISGVIVYDGSTGGTTTATATFDNYQSVIPEPAAGTLALAGLIGLLRRRR